MRIPAGGFQSVKRYELIVGDWGASIALASPTEPRSHLLNSSATATAECSVPRADHWALPGVPCVVYVLGDRSRDRRAGTHFGVAARA